MSDVASAGDVYTEYIAELLKDQDERKASIEQRGAAVITSSGALVTLLFGLVSIVTQADGFVVPDEARVPLGIALGLFVLAAVFGILTTAPRAYAGVNAADLQRAVGELWGQSDDDARRVISDTRIRQLERAKHLNQDKAKLLVAALAMQVAGVLALAVAVWRILAAA